MVSQFCPISLCNVTYKILTKVLVNWLRPFLDAIIDTFHASFIPGRSTTDNIIIAQERMHTVKHSKRKGRAMALKIDLAKAYDSVDWLFLKDTLSAFGFLDLCTRLIMNCVSKAFFSILWNGEKLPKFKAARGLRHGDLLSPCLFVMCMEELSLLIQENVSRNAWNPIELSEYGPGISHLFFADDVLFFSTASLQ